jgi:hypothetical protein
MKIKTITKVIDKKITEWLSSITDEQLKKEVKNDLIVTGGCIASMLLKEQVNDFDIYFKTKSTCLKIARYYVEQINKVYTNNISDSIVEVIDNKNIPSKSWESDSEDKSKWDFFKKSIENTDEERVKIYIPHIGYRRRSDETKAENINMDELNYEPVYLSENAISLSKQIQLVVRFFGDAETIHTNYDFAHATNYFHYESGSPKLVCNVKALQALLTKELIYIGSKYPLTSVIRTKKFITRGYTVNAGTYLKILWQVAELNLKDPVVLQEQLIGVDVAYFSMLLELLKNVEPEKLNYNYISEIIDRVFNESEESE